MNSIQRRKGWADVPLLMIIVLVTFVLFFALAMKEDSLNTRATQRQAEIMSSQGIYELLLDSIDTTWKQLAIDTVLNSTGGRFGLPLYMYSYKTSEPTVQSETPMCTDNPAICMPDQTRVDDVLTALFDAIELPEFFNLTAKIGAFRDVKKEVDMRAAAKHLSIAADRATGSVAIAIDVKGGNVNVDSHPIIRIDVPMQLNGLISAAKSAIGNASVLHSTNMLGSIDDWTTNVRTKQMGVLDGYLQTLFSDARNFLSVATQSLDERTTTRWTFSGSTLRLEYDTGVRVTEGLQSMTLIVANCTDDVDGSKYNRFAGAIEAAMPDLLNRYVEEPRALLAAVAADNHWNPTNLFANGETDAAASAIKYVRTLLASFEAGTANVQPYDDWKEACTFTSRLSLRLPLDRMTPDDMQIVGCFGDASCSGSTADNFYEGIDILARSDETVYAMEGGVVYNSPPSPTCHDDQDCPTYPELRGIGNYVIIRHKDSSYTDENQKYYYTVYGHLASILVTSGIVVAGQPIGTVGKTGRATTEMLTVRIYEKSDDELLYANPCLYLGCVPTTPQSKLNAQLPKPIAMTSPQDYADILSKRSGTVVSLGDDFCAPSDRDYRSSNLGYGFYADGSFPVPAAFGGTILGTRTAEDGCGSSLYVDSGAFVTVYSGINPSLMSGNVEPLTKIGTVATKTKLGTECPNPHLSVVFSEPSFYIYKGTDRCGKEINCRGPFEYSQPIPCNVNSTPCTPIPNAAPLNVREEYCAAVEWPARRMADGLLWTLTENGFARIPMQLGYRMNDSLAMLDCSQYDKKRFTWVNAKDALCYDGKLWTCGFDIPGAQLMQKGDCVGGTGSDCKDGYTCTDMLVSSVPDPKADALIDRHIAKFCGNPAVDVTPNVNDTSIDWLCCESLGGSFTCPSKQYWKFDGRELICEPGSCTGIETTTPPIPA